jgi:hypothetical protein
MKERMKHAATRMEKLQVKNAERRNKRKKNGKEIPKDNSSFKEGDQVLIRKEAVTNKDQDVFAKLILPWEGPYKVGPHDAKQFPNSYKVIKDDERTVVVNDKNIKRFHERPNHLKVRQNMDVEPTKERITGNGKQPQQKEQLRIEIQQETSTNAPKEMEMTTKEIEVKDKVQEQLGKVDTTVRRSTRLHQKWTPKEGDLVDVEFYYLGKKVWACGTIRAMRGKWATIDFLDGQDSDEYDLTSEKIRQCKETEKHHTCERI